MTEAQDENLKRAQSTGREMQQKYEKVIRAQRTNCVLLVVLALTVGFLAGAILQDYFSDPRKVIIVPAEDCLSV